MNSVLKNNSFILLLLLSLISCKDKDLVTSILPSEPIVRLLSPQNNQVISDSVTIQIETYDDKGIRLLSVFIDGNYQFSDNENDTIHTFFWNTSYLPEGSHHKIKALGDDGEGHVTASKEIDVVVYRFTPSNLEAHILTDTTIELKWQDNSKFETRYEIEQAGSDSIFTKIASLDSNETKYIVKGNFSPEQKYQFRVRAFVNANPSWYSNTAPAILFLTAPTNLTVDFENDTTAVLNWTDNSFFEDSFEIEVASNLLPFEKVTTAGINTSSIKIYKIFTLAQNYKFQVRAKSKSFTSGYTNVFTIQLQFPAPSDLSIQNISKTSAKLEWKDNSKFEEEFTIERAMGNNDFSEVGRVEKNRDYLIMNDLDQNTNYTFRVIARTKYNTSADSKTMHTAYSPILKYKSMIPINYDWSASALSPDRNIIALSTMHDKLLVINLYDAATATLIQTLNSTDSSEFVFWSIEFSRDNKYIAAVSNKKNVTIWNVVDGTVYKKFYTYYESSHIRFSDDLKTLGVTGYSQIYFWNYLDGSLSKMVNSGYMDISLFAFNNIGNQFVIGGSENNISLWDKNNYTKLKEIPSSVGNQNATFTKDDKYIVSTSYRQVSIWDIATGTPKIQMATGDGARYSLLSEDEKYLFCSVDKSIKCFRVSDGELVNNINQTDYVFSFRITKDGSAAISKSTYQMALWDISYGWHGL